MKVAKYTKSGYPWAAGANPVPKTKGGTFEEKNMIQNLGFREEAEKATGQSASPALRIDGEWVPNADFESLNRLCLP